tara:strand:+ start:77 stop:445 length:369 start_codon:yes stop_codon:yes gene_type:complete
MHLFIAKSDKGIIVPVEENKLIFWNKLLGDYEKQDMCFKVTIELVGKNINQAQEKLYNAFIIRASEHYGNSFYEMETMLHILKPMDINKRAIPVERWSTTQLNAFIDKANSLLLEVDSTFKF